MRRYVEFTVGYVAEVTHAFSDGVVTLSPGQARDDKWYCDMSCLKLYNPDAEVQAAIESIIKGVT